VSCSALQRVVSVLQCVAVCCSELQCVESVLQCVAVCCYIARYTTSMLMDSTSLFVETL